MLSLHVTTRVIRDPHRPPRVVGEKWTPGDTVHRVVFGLSTGPTLRAQGREIRYIALEEAFPWESESEGSERIIQILGFDSAAGETITGLSRVEHRSSDGGESRLNVHFESGKVGEISLTWRPGTINHGLVVYDWQEEKMPWQALRRGAPEELLARVCIDHDDCRANLELGRACAEPGLALYEFRVWFRPEGP